MRSFLRRKPVERARPLLGTYVTVRAGGASQRPVHAAIDRAFEAILQIHRLMSFHEAASDVSQLNRRAALEAVPVHAHTFRVLKYAHRLSRLSAGAFDISVGGQLVERGMLPAPATDLRPHPSASFHDIQLMPGRRVRFRRPLWIDLGGIAKGYAVDRGIAVLRACGITRAAINAGGDLRILGRESEHVFLRTHEAHPRAEAMIELRGSAAVATSCGATTQQLWPAPAHIQRTTGLSADTVDPRLTASVVARSCLIADALTKVVLIRGEGAASLVRKLRAQAYLHRPTGSGSQWDAIGATP
jgi:thiamine biosynthesis lipoprotein